jgi:cytochrome c peroxidase
LVTPARFDRFLPGDDSALSASERTGLRAFITLDAATTAAIVSFRDSLTGDVPANYRGP